VAEFLVPNAAHWIAEENPASLAEVLLKFLGEGCKSLVVLTQ
jgi:hypothetical protein